MKYMGLAKFFHYVHDLRTVICSRFVETGKKIINRPPRSQVPCGILMLCHLRQNAYILFGGKMTFLCPPIPSKFQSLT